MYVKDIMVTDVISIFPDASLNLAFQMMMEKGYSQLPVVQEGELLGLINEKVLSEFTPSKATTLSIYEMNYVLEKTKCEDIMLTDIITSSPEALVEEAAVVMKDENISNLPIVDDNNKLLGLITDTDILNAFIDIIGRNDSGTRIALEGKNQVGVLAEIAGIITSYNMNITHVIDYFSQDDKHSSDIIIRVDSFETKELEKELEEHGYKILSSIKNEV